MLPNIHDKVTKHSRQRSQYYERTSGIIKAVCSEPALSQAPPSSQTQNQHPSCPYTAWWHWVSLLHTWWLLLTKQIIRDTAMQKIPNTLRFLHTAASTLATTNIFFMVDFLFFLNFLHNHEKYTLRISQIRGQCQIEMQAFLLGLCLLRKQKRPLEVFLIKRKREDAR